MKHHVLYRGADLGLPVIRYSKLRFYHVVDAEDQDMGTLEDIILDEESLEPTYLLLGGGFFEEYMESKGVLDDIDELAPLDIVVGLEDEFIVLARKLEELLTTNQTGQLPVKGIKFTELCQYSVKLDGEEYDAQLYDIVIDGKESQLIFHFPTLRLSDMGYMQRIDVSFPIDMVQIDGKFLLIPTSEEEIKQRAISQIKPKMQGKSLVCWN